MHIHIFYSFDTFFFQIHATCSYWAVELVFFLNFSLFSRFVCHFSDQFHIFHAQIQQSLHSNIRFIFESPEIVWAHRIFNCHTIVTRHKYGLETETKHKQRERKKQHFNNEYGIIGWCSMMQPQVSFNIQCVRRYCEYQCYVLVWPFFRSSEFFFSYYSFFIDERYFTKVRSLSVWFFVCGFHQVLCIGVLKNLVILEFIKNH